jgi:dUTPase
MRKKQDDIFLKMAYQLQVHGLLNTINMESTPKIVDRSPLSDFAYEIVHNSMIKNKKDVLNIIDTCIPSGSPASIWLRTLKIIIVTPTDIETTLKLMKERNNGIDILTRNYVKKQNLVFSAIAQYFHYEHIKITHAKDDKLKRALNLRLIEASKACIKKIFNNAYEGKAELFSGLIQRGYTNDAGWDLFNFRMEEIAPSIWKIFTECRVKISAGYFGLIRERSSAMFGNDGNYYPTVIQGGVIDAEFEGEINIIIFSLRPNVDLKQIFENRYTHQLIIVPCCCSNVTDFKNRPPNASFGSSSDSHIYY